MLKGPQSSQTSEELLNSLVRQYAAQIKLLPDKPEESVEAAVRALWSCALGEPISCVKAMTLPLSELTEAQVGDLKNLLERRASGTPLAHLTQRQDFMGLEFRCSAAALIPRKETEILAKAAIAILTQNILPNTARPLVLDLCTGCGNLACAVARQVAECTVFASDLSAEAARLAEENAMFMGCQERVQVFVGDLFAPFSLDEYANRFDLILCNPPYISTTKLPHMEAEIIMHEPKMAFDAGPFGLAILGRLLRDAPGYLKHGGWLAFEVGAGQGNGLLQRLSKDARYQKVTGVPDANNNVRTITAQTKGDQPCLQGDNEESRLSRTNEL